MSATHLVAMRLKVSIDNTRRLVCLDDRCLEASIRDLQDIIKRHADKITSIEVTVRFTTREIAVIFTDSFTAIMTPQISIVEDSVTVREPLPWGVKAASLIQKILNTVNDVQIEVLPSVGAVMIVVPRSRLEDVLRLVEKGYRTSIKTCRDYVHVVVWL